MSYRGIVHWQQPVTSKLPVVDQSLLIVQLVQDGFCKVSGFQVEVLYSTTSFDSDSRRTRSDSSLSYTSSRSMIDHPSHDHWFDDLLEQQDRVGLKKLYMAY